MKTATRKGNALEIIAKDHLESEGHHVHRAIRSFVTPKGGKPFVRSNDIFGCFDLIAISSFEKPRFIQVTTKTKVYDRMAKIDKKLTIDPANCSIEVWGWHGRKRKYFVVYLKYKGVWIRQELPIKVIS